MYALLTEQGFTLAAARDTVRGIHGDDNGAATATAEADAEQVDEDREALKSVGIDLDKVADAVKRAFAPTSPTAGPSGDRSVAVAADRIVATTTTARSPRPRPRSPSRTRRALGRPDCGPGGRRGPGGPGLG